MKSCFAGLLEDSSLKLRMTVGGKRKGLGFRPTPQVSSSSEAKDLDEGNAKCKINFQLSIFNFQLLPGA